MSAGKAIYDILSTDSTVSGLVAARVFPFGAEQNQVKPYVVYSQISATPEKTKDRSHQIITGRYQVDIFGNTYDEASTIADAVNDALSFKSGTFGGVVVDVITFEDENDFFSDQSDVYRKEQDYLIRIRP